MHVYIVTNCTIPARPVNWKTVAHICNDLPVTGLVKNVQYVNVLSCA